MRAQFVIPVIVSILILGTLGLSQVVYADFEITDLGLLAGDTRNSPIDINEAGQIVGKSSRPNLTFGYFWENGVITDIGGSPFSTGIHQISEAGQFVGSTGSMAILWDPVNGIQYLEELPGALNSAAVAINDNGLVVGASSLPNSHISRAVLWDPVTGIQDLGDLGNNPDSIQALDVNNARQIVGTTSTNNILHVFFLGEWCNDRSW